MRGNSTARFDTRVEAALDEVFGNEKPRRVRVVQEPLSAAPTGWYTDHLRLRGSGAPWIMLYYLLISAYVLVCLLLIVVILLQQGKGGDIASAFGGGGGSQAAFGARAGATLLTKLTAGLAATFIVMSLTLAVWGQRGPGSVVGGVEAPPLPQPSANVPPPNNTTPK
jgi:preprotein translocase subunit SecG